MRFSTLSITLPLGLAYISAALEEAGHSVHVIDAVGEAPSTRTRYFTGYLVGLPLEEIAARIPTDARVVGISVIFTHEWPAVVRLVQLIKRRCPDVRVIIGGDHITSMAEFCLLSSEADIAVLGEGEETIVDLVDALERGRPLSSVDGIIFRDGESLVVNRRRRRVRDVDSIAWPAWHRFDVALYHEHRYDGCMYSSDITIPILATRGCPYQCTYCAAPNMWTPLWIPRDPARVADEIEYYVETFGARNFPFQDLTAIVRKDWIIRFCHELIARRLDITWQLPGGTRLEAIDGEVAELLRQSGMVNIAYAPESGSETTRRYIKKKIQTEQLFSSIEAAVAADLNVSLFIVAGFPHDSAEQLRENLPFLERAAKAGVTDISVIYYMALPGTELFNSLYDAGKVKFDRAYFCHMLRSLSLIPVHSYSDRLNRFQLFLWKMRLFLKFYSTKRGAARGSGLVTEIRRGLSGLREGGHNSRLQTALRQAVTSAWFTAAAHLKRGWMPRLEERRMFDGWDEIFREIRRKRLAEGVDISSPADTTQLHKGNVVHALRRDHETPRTVSFPVATTSNESGPNRSLP